MCNIPPICNRSELLGPCVQRLPFLPIIAMPIVDRGYPPLYVIQNFPDRQAGKAHAGHVGCSGTAKVVDTNSHCARSRTRLAT